MKQQSPSEITQRDPTTLHSHAENQQIFGRPKDNPAYAAVLKSIREHGIQEPLIILDDGTILSGNTRHDCALDLGLAKVPVRIHPGFGSYMEQVGYVIAANSERRQLTKRQIAIAYERLKTLSASEGGFKKERGRPRKGAQAEDQGANSKPAKARDQAAKQLKVGRETAEACVEVFRPDVPASVQHAVESDQAPATVVAQALKSERRRQGGTLHDEASVVEAVAQATKPASLEVRFDETYARLEKLLHEAVKAEPAEHWNAKLAVLAKSAGYAFKASSARLARSPTGAPLAIGTPQETRSTSAAIGSSPSK